MPVLSNMPVGAVLRYLTGNKTLLYPDETADFNIGTAQRHWERMRATEPVDKTYTEEIGRSDEHRVEAGAVPSTKEAAVPETCTPTSDGSSSPSLHEEQGPRLAAPDGSSEDPVIVVDWYSESDPERPYNWSAWKRAGVYFIILYVSTTVYMSAAIYAVAQDGVSEAFGVSATESSLGLALYVLGYGVGPMFLSPPSELLSVGRNTPYLVSMVAYLAVSFPLPSSSNLVTLLVLRFLQGFFGSPTLATGGASLTDISTQFTKPYALYQLAMFALAGPALGITLAGFTVPLMGWRWTFWEVVIITSPGLIFLMFLPETSEETILLRRARRLRIRTGNPAYRSRSELHEDGGLSMSTRLYRSLFVPWQLNLLNPSIGFTSLYCGLVYALFYSFFEFFPLVYGDVYDMSIGEVGLVFVSVVIAVLLAFVGYASFTHFVVNKAIKEGRTMAPESRLIPALFASILIPAGLFVFAWTSRRSIHWIVPVIGSMLVSGNVVIIIQSVFAYITLSYPRYVASLFSANGLFRSAVAFAGILWSHPLYNNLGVAYGMTVIACCCVFCTIGIFSIYLFGHRLRARSRFASAS